MKGFGGALAAVIKAGPKIQREGWNGSALAVALRCGTKECVRDPRQVG